MNVSRLALSLALVGLAVAPWLTLVPQADAADAKAKCRVGANPARVQIAVGANGLAAGTAQFQVTAGGNASSVLTNAVDALGGWRNRDGDGEPGRGCRRHRLGKVQREVKARRLVTPVAPARGAPADRRVPMAPRKPRQTE